MTAAELSSFKQNALQWANQFDACCCLDSNGYQDQYSRYGFIIAASAKTQINTNHGKAFDALKDFYTLNRNHWIFGFLSYDLKNELENLSSAKLNQLDFPDLFFFVPEYLLIIKDNEPEIIAGPANLIEVISSYKKQERKSAEKPHIETRISKASYLTKIEELRTSILKGDIYEVNFCQEFFAKNASIDPYGVYHALNTLSPTPFSGFFKLKDNYILSASPERFLCKRGKKLYSQPIKGTAKRSIDPAEDNLIKSNLKNNSKEQAENVMIVDLVRNDLTKNALKGTVKVEELFGIYTFPQVHQMISTVSCTLDPAVHVVDAVKHAFPMGSMTGAPKLRAMQLIEEKEESRRGIYSGALGYFDPEGDFDFNVIIRSILYNSAKKYLSFQVGGAITYASDAEAEYEECLLKASAILKTLTADI